jgi:hypothetical protein
MAQPHEEPPQPRDAPDGFPQPPLVYLQSIRRRAKPAMGEIEGRCDLVFVKRKIVGTGQPRKIGQRQEFAGSRLRAGRRFQGRRPAGLSGWLRAA